jgi:hypothetical protein
LELRQNKRYRLSAPVSFSWESREGAVDTGEGHTRDISVSGVFILAAGLIPEGSLVRMEVNLPPLHAEGQRVRLRTQGRVVRTEDNGFAAIANMGFRMDFHEVESGTHGVTIVRKDEDKKKTEDASQGWLS